MGMIEGPEGAEMIKRGLQLARHYEELREGRVCRPGDLCTLTVNVVRDLLALCANHGWEPCVVMEQITLKAGVPHA